MSKRNNSSRMGNHSNRRRLDNDDNNHSWGLWAHLPHDILFKIIMMLGVIDYIKVSWVCKSWRSFALSNREFIFSKKEPLLLTLLKQRSSHKRFCFVEDIFGENRRYKTTLTSTSRGTLSGVSCGYLILLTRTTYKFCLVNLMTRHQLFFPVLPKTSYFFSRSYHAILVYSSLLSKYIIVIYSTKQNLVKYCVSGDSHWVILSRPGNDWDIASLNFFKGKIYMLNYDGRIGEISLYPMNSLKFLDVKRVPHYNDNLRSFKWYSRKLVTSSNRLFMVDILYSNTTKTYELDFEKMEWVVRDDLEEDSLFYSDISSSVVTATNPERRGRTYSISPYLCDPNDSYAWYFPRECYARNILNDS